MVLIFQYNATQVQFRLAERTGTYYIIIINFFVFSTNSNFASVRRYLVRFTLDRVIG